MNKFTDEDLKRLKDELPIAEHLGQLALRDEPKRISALLARLEAGEKALKGYYDLEDERISYDEVVTRYVAWRKAAGKEGR